MMNQAAKLILTGAMAIIGTVFVLDGNGYIQHSSEQDALEIGQFVLLANKPGQQQVVSAKKAEFSARCYQGYLVMDATGKASADNLSGLLVDHKNRPVMCR